MSSGGKTPVVIAGAGPVGKVLALELARHGVPSTLVDPGTGVTPGARARLTNARTMEHLRRLGLADRVRELAPLPSGYPVRSVYVTRITGVVLAEFVGAYASQPDPRYPEPSQYIPQDRMEQALLEGVWAEPRIELLLGSSVDDFADTEDGVAVSVSGRTIVARFLIGCDGAHSTVRKRLGVELSGERGIMHSVGVEFRSQRLRELIDASSVGLATQHWIVNPDAPVLISTMDGRDLWTLQYISGQKQETDDPLQLIRLAVGAEVDVEVLETAPWSAHRLLAESFGRGRVFIAGDAAHMHPPTGGYGMNTGIGDAVNLAWKIAAIEAGWGDEHLLETYELERRPVHQRVIEEAVETGSVLPEDFAGEERLAALGEAIRKTKARQHYAIGVIFGDRYDESPLTEPDGSPPDPVQTTDFVQSGRPGARAPHVWLDDGSSLYDHFGTGYTLLDLRHDGRGDFDSDVPVTYVRVENDELRALAGADLLLIRPDQHVAWRGDELPEPAALAARLRGAVLAGALE